MELTNEFRVSVPVEQAWAVLTDLERIAPCMPGAELQEVEGHEYRGVVKVKVGPITAQYKGKASFTELDPSAHRAVLRAEGRDTRGQGNASATVTAQLSAQGQATEVTISTDLAVTGKVAQFGRGVLADVSAKLLDQFVVRLEADVLSGSGTGSAAAPPASAPAAGPDEPVVQPEAAAASTRAAAHGAQPDASPPEGEAAEAKTAPGPGTGTPERRIIHSAPARPVDLLDAAGGSLVKRLAPVGLGLLIVLILWRLLRRS
jgi:carbon monoxide dehydrogenase subunit G